MDSGLDDSSASEDSRPRRTTSLKLPSMYSPESKPSIHASPASNGDASNDDASNDDASNDTPSGDDAFDFDTLPVSNEIKELFQLIDAYEPVDLELETPLKCFMPPYIPSVGEVDPLVKIPRPDGIPDGLGTAILDEPIPSLQSNPAVIELQQRNRSKKGSERNATVHSVKGIALENTNEIDQWIEGVEEVHSSRPSSEVRHQNKMPSTGTLLQPWPKEIEDKLADGTVDFPSPDIDLSVEEYLRVVCSLLGIPVHEGHVIESAHVLCSLFLEMQDRQAHQELL